MTSSALSHSCSVIDAMACPLASADKDAGNRNPDGLAPGAIRRAQRLAHADGSAPLPVLDASDGPRSRTLRPEGQLLPKRNELRARSFSSLPLKARP